MPGVKPEQQVRLAEVFATLAETLVAGQDVLDLLSELVDACVELLDVDAAGVLLADDKGRLRTVAASDEQARMLELFQLQAEDGPCPECYRTNDTVTSLDLQLDGHRWPRLVPYALSLGYRAVHARPLRSRETVIGALNLLSLNAGPLPRDDQEIARSLASVATLSILRDRQVADHVELNSQLRSALQSRVVIEQAKGILAERSALDLGAAFGLIRGHARRHQTRIGDVAHQIVSGQLDPTDT